MAIFQDKSTASSNSSQRLEKLSNTHDLDPDESAALRAMSAPVPLRRRKGGALISSREETVAAKTAAPTEPKVQHDKKKEN